MSRFIFRLPDIGEGIAEAEIVAWHVAVGDVVEQDQRVADLMTDKATVEMESPVSGTIVELAAEVGAQIAIGSMLVTVETSGAAAEAAITPGRDAVPLNASAAPAPEVVEQAAPVPDAPECHARASPAVRRRAASLGIDLAAVKAQGPYVRHADLDAYLRYGSAQGYRAPAASAARNDEVVKVIGLRRRIAENMAASKRHIPHFTYIEEIDITALDAIRADLNANRLDRPKLTLLPLLIVGICRTLPSFPMLNARYDDEAGVVTRCGRINIGIATQTDAGLMVPVVRNAQDLNIWQLAAEIARLADAARTGKARSEELSGSTITVTSLGPLGGIATTPVINRPEVAIIGPNRIVERPIFDGDKIRRAKLMNISISCDHRVVDGMDAARYIQALKRQLEVPVLLFADD